MWPKISPYWTCQILGWGSIIPYWLYYEPAASGYALPIALLVSNAIVQVIFTDQYRRLAHRKGWLQLPLPRLIPIILLAWLFLSCEYVVVSYAQYMYRYEAGYNGSVLLGMVAGGSRYHAIWLLAFHLYHFAQRSANEAAAAARNAQLAAEAQLAKLNAELNPHFFFNALNSIKALTREDPARSRTAINQLAELLRYSLRKSNHPLVPLRDEVAIVKDYLELEQLRLEERLIVDWDLPSSLDYFFLPPLGLHCLVENGIKHGVAPRERGGKLGIQINVQEDEWHISVNSPGSYQLSDSSGLGLSNLRQRLEILYQGKASLAINSSDDVVTATLHFPYRNEKNQVSSY